MTGQDLRRGSRNSAVRGQREERPGVGARSGMMKRAQSKRKLTVTRGLVGVLRKFVNVTSLLRSVYLTSRVLYQATMCMVLPCSYQSMSICGCIARMRAILISWKVYILTAGCQKTIPRDSVPCKRAGKG
ncbi:hypothetical protein HOLleu_38004 [Holothuria leucospilota]|uniref:Uncharacterized protein n=1 Tax=Holothuria leucospilota TaxID=206669 RepID=A0A9Q1BDS4_HOLLE|nr:hypothetical protein HOLleu_38004 [Holothuria leucospilota]